MGSSSKELLQLEHKKTSANSPLESTLLVCKKASQPQTQKPPSDGNPITTPVSQSQVLGKVRDFLGVISEANKQLNEDAKDNSQKYDIELLTGNESEVIEMDLMLGIADLHTPEAVAAAESAIARSQPSIPLDTCSSETESEYTSDDDESGNEDTDDDNDVKGNDASYKRECISYADHKMPKSSKEDSSEAVQKKSSKKRPKIVEMS